MSKSLEDGLRQFMTWLGHLIERGIGEAKKAKVSVGTRGGVQPILSLESQLPVAKIQQMITAATERIYLPVIPHLDGKCTLEIGEGKPVFAQQFLQKQARLVVEANISEASSVAQGDASRGYVVNAQTGAVPFADNFFDYIVGRLGTGSQGDIVKSVKEMGRVLMPGGQGVFIDFHPFGLFSRKGAQRMLAVESTIRGLEDYYKICRSAELRIVNLREAFIDENLRSVFSHGEIQSYRNVKGTPLLLFIFFFKPRTK
jgi:ubiquinone/menaquinone biosynthesis C-methylase UbiE